MYLLISKQGGREALAK